MKELNLIVNKIIHDAHWGDMDTQSKEKKALVALNRIIFLSLIGYGVSSLENNYWEQFAEAVAGNPLINTATAIDKDHFSMPRLNKQLLEYINDNISKDIHTLDQIAGLYQRSLDHKSRRGKGVFYTQQDVVDYMIDSALSNLEISDTINILDPSCGTGNFLSGFLRIAKDKLPKATKLNLYGIDIDGYAGEVTITRILVANDGYFDINISIIQGDALFYPLGGLQFDLIIGNPPYIGHKQLTLEYKQRLKKAYPCTYRDKADISYCFFDKFIDCLKEEGILSFITSRYFLEALHGEGLRRKIEKNKILEIIDFYGYRILEGIQVDPLIISLKNNDSATTTSIKRVITPGDTPLNQLLSNNSPSIAYFTLDKDCFRDGKWNIHGPKHNTILDKIKNKGGIRLGEMVESFQGIITGCDKAFILDQHAIDNMDIDPKLLRPWLKNRHVDSYKIDKPSQYIIYTDDIDNIQLHPSIYDNILAYKGRLEERRECIKGLRKWYQLQWGRDKVFFEQPKIIYRYKSDKNTFALDYDNYYFSADIYGIVIKGIYGMLIDYPYLLCILNSSVVEFYLKTICKKLGEKIYEYYPNKILTTLISLDLDKEYLREKYDQIISGHLGARKELDEYLYKYYELEEDEKIYVEEWIGK